MSVHLKAIGKAVKKGAHAIVVIDGAGYHTAKKLKVPRNITLLPLPPYSPELNPCENVWQFLRQNILSNRVFDGIDAIIDACCDAWLYLCDDIGRIRSIGTRAWAVTGQ
jgi:transposase